MSQLSSTIASDMTCPSCGRYAPPDPQTGYDVDDLCPECERDGIIVTPVTTMEEDLQRLEAAIERKIEQFERIKQILSTFYLAEISMSSLQPVLDLACELNPALKLHGQQVKAFDAIIDTNDENATPF